MKECTHCGQAVMATRASVWYMHDNHTFTKLEGDIDEVIVKARQLGEESPYGTLCTVILLNGERETGRAGISVHAHRGFTEDALQQWRHAAMADPDVDRLLAAKERGR